MLGTALCQALSSHELITPARYELNIGNFEQVKKFKDFDFIVHLAAETDHELCDLNPSQCYFANTIGTAHMTRLAIEHRKPILYLSAGSIFDGEKLTSYNTEDIPNPINHYNSSKWYGELLCRAYRKHYILRAGWMFGGGPQIDKKFVNKIMKKIKSGQTEIMVCDDCIGSPTYSVDLAETIKFIIEDEIEYGTYHFVNEGEGASRYAFAQEIVKALDSKVKIAQCRIDDLKDEFPCKRTNYEVLKTSFGSRHWKEALKEYILAKY